MAEGDLQEIDGLEFEELEVSGARVLKHVDDKGKVFLIPAEVLEDFDGDKAYKSATLSYKKIPGFAYEVIPSERVEELLATGYWVVVTRAEAGLTDPRSFGDAGEPEATPFRVGSCYLMRCPQAVADAANRRDNMEARRVRESVKPTPEQLATVRKQGVGFQTQIEERQGDEPTLAELRRAEQGR